MTALIEVVWTAITVAPIIVLLLVLIGGGVATLVLYQLDRFTRRGTYTAKLGNLAGFADKYSYFQGERVCLFIHTTAATNAQVIRYGVEVEEVGIAFNIPRSHQSNRFHQIKGFDWCQTTELETMGLAPGFYGVRLTHENNEKSEFIIPLIVKPSQPKAISVIMTTTTWDAYNDYGGISNYTNTYYSWLTGKLLNVQRELAGPGHFHETYLPKKRPNSLIADDLKGQVRYSNDYHSRHARNDWAMIGFLEEHGYDYGVYSDRDLAFDEIVQESSLLIFAGHGEYWSPQMLNAFDRFIELGGRIFVASGKPMAELVLHNQDATQVLAHEVVLEDTAKRVGTIFTLDGAYTAAPYKASVPQSWLFDGTSLPADCVFGRDSANRAWPDGMKTKGIGGSGASGFFTGKIGPGSSGFKCIARGLNAEGPADMVFRETPQGGWVFNASSETFVGAAPRDEVVAGMLRNLLDDACLSHAKDTNFREQLTQILPAAE